MVDVPEGRVCHVLDQLLTNRECRDIIDAAEQKGFMDAGTAYPPAYRNNDRQLLDDPQLAETIVDLLVTEILQARRTNETIDPETLASKREALLARGGAAVEEVAARRLAAVTWPSFASFPNNSGLSFRACIQHRLNIGDRQCEVPEACGAHHTPRGATADFSGWDYNL